MKKTRILVVDDEHHFEAIKSGADGYFTKIFRAEDLFTLLSEVTKGECICLVGGRR